MKHCADDDDYDGRRMELEGGREREIAERQGKAGPGEGRSGVCRALFSREKESRRENKRNKLIS